MLGKTSTKTRSYCIFQFHLSYFQLKNNDKRNMTFHVNIRTDKITNNLELINGE